MDENVHKKNLEIGKNSQKFFWGKFSLGAIFLGGNFPGAFFPDSSVFWSYLA